MLITRTGFKAFKDYDLSRTLDNRLDSIKAEMEKVLKSDKDLDKEKYINETISKNRIEPIKIDSDQESISIESEKAMIPSEWFPSSGYLIQRGESYEKDVLRFYVPFSGDPQLFRMVSSTRIMSTQDIDLDNNHIIFEIIKFSDDPNNIKRERDNVIKYLVDQSGYINKQVEVFNGHLEEVVKKGVENALGKITKDEDFLSQLGNKIKTPNQIIDNNVTKIPEDEKELKHYDVFISHVSEDKDFVEPLAQALQDAGVQVWYDKFVLDWGDDLRTSIDEGLMNSSIGLVIFSKTFLGKKDWTEHEFDSLFAREKINQKVIYPIWHKITRDDLMKYSPKFADRLALKSDESIENIVSNVKNIISKFKTM